MPGPMVLIGMMGSGKTRVGRELSRISGLPWEDLDRALEIRHGMSVARQFRELGEPVFRARETEMLRHFCARERLVLSAGGGVVLAAANRTLLRRTTTIYLKASPETIQKRLGTTARLRRPLLAGRSPAELGEFLKDLAAQRGPLYRECATFTVRADVGDPADVARRIWAHVSAAEGPAPHGD